MAQRKRSAWLGNFSPMKSRTSSDTNLSNGKTQRVRDFKIILFTAVVTSILLVELINLFNLDVNFTSQDLVNSPPAAAPAPSPTIPSNQTGSVALTTSQLKAEIAKIGVPVFWLGDQAGALYTLTNLNNGAQIFVRYLPDGKVPTGENSTNRVISTYAYPKAFDTLKSASKNSADGVGANGPDGSFIYYSKNKKTNVYVAFPTIEAQIEIYDPTEGAALKLANTKGLVQLIK